MITTISLIVLALASAYSIITNHRASTSDDIAELRKRVEELETNGHVESHDRRIRRLEEDERADPGVQGDQENRIKSLENWTAARA